MFYITFRSINATVRSLQAAGEIAKAEADAVVALAQPLRISGDWASIREEIKETVINEAGEFTGEYIVNEVEKDAAISSSTSKIVEA